MKAIGIVRRIDDLGRICLPKESRNTFGIKEGDPLEILTTDQGFLIRKYAPGCTMCGSVDEPIAVTVGDKQICRACATVIRS